ncbi:MAG: EAL domain-containing protein [Acidimicrobiia bacterium]
MQHPSPAIALAGESGIGFEVLTDSSPVGIFYTDAGGRLLYANPRWFEITGLSRERAHRSGWLDRVHPDDLVDVSGRLAALAEGDEFFARFRMRCGPGAYLWVHGRAAPVRDPDSPGVVVGFVGSLADVTPQVASHDERTRLTEILETTTDYVVTADSHGQITYLNGAAALAFSVPTDAALPKLVDLLVDESRWMYEAAVLPHVLAHGTWTGELTFRSDDAVVPASVAVTVHLDAGGAEAYVSLVARDVSEAKALEARLVDSEARFRSLVQNASDLIMVTDAAGTLTYLSPSITRLLGWRFEDLVGRSILTLVHPDDAALMRMRALAPTSGAAQPFDIRVRSADAGERLFEVVVTNLLSEPTVRGYVANARDVTAQRHHEGQLSRMAERQRTVAELGRRALEGEDLDSLMTAAARVAAITLGTEYAAVLELLVDRNRLAVRWAYGWPQEWLGRTLVTADADSQAGRSLEATQPVVVHGLSEEKFPASRPLHEMGVDSGVDVRIGDRGNPFGVLAVHTRKPRRFSTDDLHFLQNVAHVLAAAVGRRRAEEETRHRALHDDLTGLPNRALLIDRIEQALARCERNGTRCAVMFCDVDQFKVVNDSLGHTAGDELLVTVARRLTDVLRPDDTVARFGGDEFVIVCDSVTGEDAALEIAGRIADKVAEPVTVGDREIVLTTSVGIAFGTGRATDPDALIADADAAMYHAKARGRARTEVFDDHLRAGNLARLDTVNALRRALDTGELRLHYQPEVDLASGHWLGFEALLRWERPDHGLVLPEHFVPVAEDSGLIVPIGAWVLREATAQLRAWEDERPGVDLTVAVNLSARQLADPALPRVVASAVETAGIDPRRLKLEITESVIMEDVAWSQTALESLRSLGVRVVVDDFGTGYSSLSYLRQFPVDQLKIDRSFVSGVDGDAGNWAIVEAVISMARALGLAVTAEGVETPEQAAALARLGCTTGQGFLFARPRPAAEALSW